MSINDLLDSKIFIPGVMVFILIILIFAIPTGLAMGSKTNNDIYGDAEYGEIQVEKNVKVVARRNAPHPFNQSVIVNMVVFELSNGSRVELAIKDQNTYGIIVEGDCGTLKYNGKKFVDFEREV